jgi:predicted nucleic acid-binding protein
MNVVDSSAWLEYFMDGPNAAFFAPAIEAAPALLVPSVCLFEVLKRFLNDGDKLGGLERASAMHTGRVVDLDERLALQAAEISVRHGLAMADSIIYAVACQHGAQLWTQDQDFKDLPGVRFVPAGKRP